MNDRVTGDDCLFGFALWCDNPHVFIHIRDSTVSLLKSRLTQVFNRCMCR